VVPQSCDRDDPAVVMISRMQYMDMFNNTIMNKSIAKGVNTTNIIATIASIITPITITIIVTILHQVATNYSEWEHSSDRIEPLLHQ
jgi:hypothetical protein